MHPLLLLLAFPLPTEAGTEQIIGGHEAKPHSHPYMAYVQFLDKGHKMRCGGVLVRENFVLTAAHCSGSKTKVTLGAHNIKEQEKTQQVFLVRKAIPHPDYNPKNFSKDIMLLKLERNIKPNKAVKPLRLPRGEDWVRPGQKCTVAGWGRDEMGTLANTLQQVELTIQKDRECKSRFPSYYSRDTQICVGDPKKRMTGFKSFPEDWRERLGIDQAGKNRQSQAGALEPMKGDSGGPLVCNNTVQGIFSFGNKKPPGVYMSVSHFLTWIKKTMKHL